MNSTIAWGAMLGLSGAIVGSFVAALAIRWPEGRSVVRGRSRCDACGQVLRAGELVPLVSYLMLRGRCRRCAAPIDPRHPCIELLAAAIGVCSALVAPGLEGAAGAAFGWMLLTLAALDLAAFWLPDRLTGLLALGGLAGGCWELSPALDQRLIGGFAGWSGLWLVGRTYRLVRRREGLGGGDSKLLGAIGLWLGWRLLPAVLLIASMIGLGVALAAAWRGRAIGRETAMPFGVFLAAAAYPAWVAMLWAGAS